MLSQQMMAASMGVGFAAMPTDVPAQTRVAKVEHTVEDLPIMSRELTLPRCKHGQPIGNFEDIQFLCSHCGAETARKEKINELLSKVIQDLSIKFNPNLIEACDDLRLVREMLKE